MQRKNNTIVANVPFKLTINLVWNGILLTSTQERRLYSVANVILKLSISTAWRGMSEESMPHEQWSEVHAILHIIIFSVPVSNFCFSIKL